MASQGHRMFVGLSMKSSLFQTKESVQELESSLQRIGVDSRSMKEIESYLTLRKKMKKLISNCFEGLMKMKKQNILDQDSQDEATLNILRDVERMSISVFETLPSSSFEAKGEIQWLVSCFKITFP
ncbi:hypothetical protein CRG98_038783 [Punica granatum]|uniref:Uncharacterized protein n=1 Tax=Punica granatum TaxID=22663 RepID=A0A2I0I9W9_PUNGR|nr:hypothetical protein CRG98_038783 [Punica granatum]